MSTRIEIRTRRHTLLRSLQFESSNPHVTHHSRHGSSSFHSVYRSDRMPRWQWNQWHSVSFVECILIFRSGQQCKVSLEYACFTMTRSNVNYISHFIGPLTEKFNCGRVGGTSKRRSPSIINSMQILPNFNKFCTTFG